MFFSETCIFFFLAQVQGSKCPTIKFIGGCSGETIELNVSILYVSKKLKYLMLKIL